MIKLNDKNITYVAFADSNNSLKAPKEIWYADSNNSVKLVYRRKDALIEGEDYEKYHWLVSNSEDSQTPYIDTLIPPNLNQNIVSSFKVINSANNGGEPGIWGAILGTSWSNCVIRCFKPKSYGYTILEFNNNNIDFPQKENMIIKTEFSEGKEYDCSLSINSSTTALGVINNESKELVANSNVNFVLNPQPTYKLFVEMNASTWSFNSVGFKKFNITNLISLVPCKLLKPVPKWLDANGIRRQVGECGMIDLISGKFYGNVNSVGTFTVENYYERKEWLVGDGSAFLNTDGKNALIGINSVEWELSGNGQAVLNSFGLTTGAAQFVSDLSYVDGSIGKIGIYDNNRAGYFWTTKLNVNTLRLVSGTTIKAITINDVDLSNPNYQWYGNFILQFINRAAGYKVSKVTVDGSVRYIPCTLTMDLPASMDANNIARTKGTSGMWDLVSDRFYGNVANSGTFKAVNLAEGVDYEVHQWLVGDGMAYINTKVKLHFATDSVYIKGRNNGVPTNDARYFGNYSGGQNAKSLELIYNKYVQNDTVNKQSPNDGRFRINPSSEFEFFTTPFSSTTSVSIIYNGDTTIFNVNLNEEYLEYEASNDLILLNTNDTRYYMKADVANFKVMRSSTIILNLIPVKLLRSIPSKYDANGIARQAGECGMYDTVNDLFYGNVASSGTFSVEDDN